MNKSKGCVFYTLGITIMTLRVNRGAVNRGFTVFNLNARFTFVICPYRTLNKVVSKFTNKDMLTVDGGWSDLGDWSDCSAECAGGSQIASKTCTNPSPTNGGKECEGKDEEERTCNPDPCPG